MNNAQDVVSHEGNIEKSMNGTVLKNCYRNIKVTNKCTHFFQNKYVMIACNFTLFMFVCSGIREFYPGKSRFVAPGKSTLVYSFFFACPSAVFRQRAANFNEQTVSERLYRAGLMLTNIITLES